MVESSQLLDALEGLWELGPLSGFKVVVTAGPTREPIDPVRYITNRSSGKMGYAVAAAAAKAGAEVVLVSGPTQLTTPSAVTRIDVESAQAMLEAVRGQLTGCHIFIATAAVADYRPAEVADQKIKKNEATLNIGLERTQDILAEVTASSDAPFTVGFAAETCDVEAYAMGKLERKGLDMVAANQVGQAGSGFDADNNALTVLWREGKADIPMASKTTVAQKLMDVVIERYHAQG